LFNIGTALSTSLRHDISAKYMKMMVDISIMLKMGST
jgi:hypothetical protein